MSAQQCFRFIDSEDHYEDRQLALLLRALQVNSMEMRQAFFLDVRGCRRRHQKNVWQVLNLWSGPVLLSASDGSVRFDLCMSM
jgi:hypothetical protein